MVFDPVKGCTGGEEFDNGTQLKIIDEELPPPKVWPNYAWGDMAMLELVAADKIVIKGNKKFPRVRALRKLIHDVVGPIVQEYTNIAGFGLN